MSDIDLRKAGIALICTSSRRVQHIVILAEHRLLDYKGVEKRFEIRLRPLRYPRWLVAFMVGLSCSLLFVS